MKFKFQLQSGPNDCWSEPVSQMDAPRWEEVLIAIGGDGMPAGCGGGFLRGYAAAKGLYDEMSDCIRLPKEK